MDSNINNVVGRPKIEITGELLVALRQKLGTWKAVADTLGVSEMTIYRRLKEFNIPREYTRQLTVKMGLSVIS